MELKISHGLILFGEQAPPSPPPPTSTPVAPSGKVCVVTSVASFLVLGGGQENVHILRERAPQKHIFSGLKIHLPTYTINAFSFTYGMAL